MAAPFLRIVGARQAANADSRPVAVAAGVDGSTPKFSHMTSRALPGETWSTPAVGSVDAGRLPILVTADRSGHVVAYRGSGLEEVWRRFVGDAVTASPTVGDIDADGADEVVIGTEAGMLFAFRLRDGTELWRTTCGSAIRATAALADVDRDGGLEILVSGYGAWMFCLEGRTGRRRWRRYLPKHEFYRSSKAGVVSSPLVADVDLDGELEVVTGTRSRRVFCLSAATGRLKWFRELRYDPDSSPSFAVVGGMPIVFIGGGEHTGGAGDNALLALRGSDGAVVWRAPVHGGLDSSPIIADINGDGQAEVVITSLADASCYAFAAATGAMLWRHRFGPTAECAHDVANICRPRATGNYFTGNATCRSYTTPLVTDIDGDGALEVVVGSNNGSLVALAGTTGALRKMAETGGIVRGSPILADLDGDGRQHLVVSSGARLLVYGTHSPGPPFPMFKGRADHMGWLSINSTVPPASGHLPVQRLRYVKLFWYWWVVDAVRYVLFQVERRLLQRFGIKLREYYY